MSNSDLVKCICKKKREKAGNEVNTPLLSKYFLRGHLSVVEDTLLFHLWLKNDNDLKSNFTVKESIIDSRATTYVKHYLEKFKGNINCGDNILKNMDIK